PQPTPHSAHPVNDTTDQEDTPPQTAHDQALLVAFLGLMLALNVRGCAEAASDFLGGRVFSAFYHNDLILRAPAAVFALLGAILSLINLKILFFGF
ncbi:hypothetical protein, partial [Streptomyces sp. NPDC053728]|uniref:hypothetical protein n=1 Tax=Streptomyces sp. NPDC053728 TaxID=3155534 RepID=UPI0034386FE5